MRLCLYVYVPVSMDTLASVSTKSIVDTNWHRHQYLFDICEHREAHVHGPSLLGIHTTHHLSPILKSHLGLSCPLKHKKINNPQFNQKIPTPSSLIFSFPSSSPPYNKISNLFPCNALANHTSARVHPHIGGMLRPHPSGGSKGPSEEREPTHKRHRHTQPNHTDEIGVYVWALFLRREGFIGKKEGKRERVLFCGLKFYE